MAEELDDHSLEERLYPRPSLPRSATKPEPDFAYIHAELSRPGVTRLLLWQEYKAAHAHGWQYTSLARVCERATAAS